MLRVLSLCDNLVDDKKCWAAEGASFLIIYEDVHILFDTGRSIEVLLHNLEAKNIDIAPISHVVLSHGHKGHIGAMEPLLAHLHAAATIVFGKGIANQKYKVVDGNSTLGSAASNAELVEKIKKRGRFIEANHSFQLTEKVAILSNIPLIEDALTAFSGRYMVVDGESRDMDLFAEELALCIAVDDRLLIISGCSHRGIDNIVSCAQAFLPQRSILGIIGGLHTKNNEKKTQELIKYLSGLQIDLLAPCHCTGMLSQAMIHASFPDVYCKFSTGMELAFGLEDK